jgi:hypothetical protein
MMSVFLMKTVTQRTVLSKVGKLEQQYMNTMLANPSLKSWIADGIKETEVLAYFETDN